MPASSLDLWDVIADEAVAESPLWADSLLPPAERHAVPVFSPLLADPRFAVGLETIAAPETPDTSMQMMATARACEPTADRGAVNGETPRRTSAGGR